MVRFQGRLFAHLFGLNPDSTGASTMFLADSRFVPVTFLLAARSNVVSLVKRRVKNMSSGSHIGKRIAGHYKKRYSFQLYICRVNS